MTEHGPQEHGPLLVVVGPTASGKTRVVELLAERFAIEAVAADAMQVYRGMDTGTDKPPRGPLAPVRYHAVDVADPRKPFSAAVYQRLAVKAIGEIRERGALPVLVGGTGLYVRAVVDRFDLAPGGPDSRLRRELAMRARREGPDALWRELCRSDPAAAERIPASNVRRVIRALEWIAAGEQPSERHKAFGARPERPGVLMVGLRTGRDELRRRIAFRVEEMVAAGLEEEVRGLWEGGRLGPTARQAIGYKELVEHFEGFLTREEALSRIVARTRQYAKRQLTWFARDERLTWVDASDVERAAGTVASLVQDRLGITGELKASGPREAAP